MNSNAIIPFSFLNHWLLNWIAENKAANLIWANGFMLASEDEKIDRFLKKIIEKNDLTEFFYKNEHLLSLFGRNIIWFEKTDYLDFPKLRMSSPIFPIWINSSGEYTTKVWCIEIRQRGYEPPDSYLRAINLSLNSVGYSESFGTMSTLISTPLTLTNFKIYKSKPFIDMLNKPVYNPNILSLNFRNPDSAMVSQDDIDKFDKFYDAIFDDIMISKNRLILTDDVQMNEKTAAEEKSIVEKTILRKSSAAAILGGTEIRNEFLKANPNNDLLWNNFEKEMNYIFQKCGYSHQVKSKDYATATEQHYSKDLDLTTTEIKRKLRRNKFEELFDNILVEYDFWDGQGKRPYRFDINDHVIIDKDKTLARLQLQMQMGGLTIVELNEKLHNKDPIQAREYVEAVVEERKKWPELFNFSAGGGNQSQEEKLKNPDKKTQDGQMKKNDKIQK